MSNARLLIKSISREMWLERRITRVDPVLPRGKFLPVESVLSCECVNGTKYQYMMHVDVADAQIEARGDSEAACRGWMWLGLVDRTIQGGTPRLV